MYEPSQIIGGGFPMSVLLEWNVSLLRTCSACRHEHAHGGIRARITDLSVIDKTRGLRHNNN